MERQTAYARATDSVCERCVWGGWVYAHAREEREERERSVRERFLDGVLDLLKEHLMRYSLGP